jgi:hypothetical protein
MGSRLVLSYPIVRFRLWYYGLFRQLQSLFAGQKSASRKFHRIALRNGFEQLDGLVMLKGRENIQIDPKKDSGHTTTVGLLK